jgi:tRNA threonylcarbamoyladenosine biosynthesis protein TsaE
MKNLRSYSSEETKEFGSALAQTLISSKKSANSGATIIALEGELGAGKTTFVQGFFKGLGIKKRPSSPTFVIMRRTAIRSHEKFSNVFHMDAYRLKDATTVDVLGFSALCANPKNIILIEWPQKIKEALPKRGVICLNFHHGKKENERIIKIK